MKWIVVVILAVATHFSASYLVPLDDQAKREFWGLLRWAWPWAYGDRGLFGKISPTADGLPAAGLLLALASVVLLFLALLGVLNWWIPFGWWKPLAVAGAALSLVLMLSFFSATKVIPILLNVFILYLALSRQPILSPD